MKTAIIIMSDPKSGSDDRSGESLMPLPSHPNVSRRAMKSPWPSMGPALVGRLSLPNCRIRPTTSTIRFVMWCKAPPVAVRRSLGRPKVSSRAGYR